LFRLDQGEEIAAFIVNFFHLDQTRTD
jgi:hypothetical protein